MTDINKTWVWMTHPTRMNGKPFPALLFTDDTDGKAYYKPFDENGTDFELLLADADTKIVRFPSERDLKDAAIYRWLRKNWASGHCFLVAIVVDQSMPISSADDLDAHLDACVGANL